MRLLNNAESQSSGTTLTTGNSGGTDADAFTAVQTTPANVTLTFDNTHPAHGTNAFMVNQLGATPSATYVEWDSTVLGTNHRLFIGLYGYFGTLATSSLRGIAFLNGATVLGYVGLCNSGTFQNQFRTNADAAIGTATSAANATGTLYRWEIDITFGASGTGTISRYTGNNTSQDGTPGSITAGQLGSTLDCNKIRIGMTTANYLSAAGSFWFDSINVNDTALPGPGPYTNVIPATFPPLMQSRSAVTTIGGRL